MNYVKYTTNQGERLDTIARKLYGDPTRWKDIIDANPTLPLIPNYEAGVVLRVPIIETETPTGVIENLPPWKR